MKKPRPSGNVQYGQDKWQQQMHDVAMEGLQMSP